MILFRALDQAHINIARGLYGDGLWFVEFGIVFKRYNLILHFY